MMNSVFVTPKNRWWQERIDALGQSAQNGVNAIGCYARRTQLQEIAAGAPVPTWADLVEGDLAQTCADLINDVFAASEEAGVSAQTIMDLVLSQRRPSPQDRRFVVSYHATFDVLFDDFGEVIDKQFWIVEDTPSYVNTVSDSLPEEVDDEMRVQFLTKKAEEVLPWGQSVRVM